MTELNNYGCVNVLHNDLDCKQSNLPVDQWCQRCKDVLPLSIDNLSHLSIDDRDAGLTTSPSYYLDAIDNTDPSHPKVITIGAFYTRQLAELVRSALYVAQSTCKGDK
jgi:hypothetical protein